MPGVYDIGGNTVTMTDYTVIAGSGKGFTKIVAQGVAISCAGIGSEVRDIAIVSNQTGVNVGAAGVSLANVFIHVETPGPNVILGMEVSGGDVTINGSKIEVIGTKSAGIHLGLSGGLVTAKNSDISSSQYGINIGMDNWSSPGNWSEGGYFSSPGTVKVFNSNVTGGTNSVWVAPNHYFYAANGQFDGTCYSLLANGPCSALDPSVSNASEVKMVNCFDNAFNPIMNH